MLSASSLHDQTARTIEQEFKDCIEEAKMKDELIVVESSGTNQLKKYGIENY